MGLCARLKCASSYQNHSKQRRHERFFSVGIYRRCHSRHLTRSAFAVQPKIIIIAGPNGAGKTTFAREFLPGEAGCPVFVNADLIAAGLSPFAPERAAIQAGRLTLDAIAQHVAHLESFAFETTLSGKAYARQIPQWQALGYRVELFFLGLPTADMAVQRVAERVRQGGHNIPEPTIRRRFEAGRRLLAEVYQSLVDQWVVYDNAGDEPVLVDWSEKQ
ncbi:MAG: zeta toxin family protein [Burkholderiales bacterium]|nr:zeta toxin family protein [Burkholderiales bacterium]